MGKSIQKRAAYVEGRAALFALALLAVLALSGCVANDDNAMPWAAPDPNESSIMLPGSFTRP